MSSPVRTVRGRYFMIEHEHASMMLVMAERDLDTLQRMLRDSQFAEEVFGFHAQQAVEKALKAWIIMIGAEYPLTHDLQALIDVLNENMQTFPERFTELLSLSAFAVTFRYEPYDSLECALDRSDLTRLIGELIAHVKAQLPEE